MKQHDCDWGRLAAQRSKDGERLQSRGLQFVRHYPLGFMQMEPAVSLHSEILSVLAAHVDDSGKSSEKGDGGLSFAIGGHRFIALASEALKLGSKGSVVGRIHMAGGNYVILDDVAEDGGPTPSFAETLSRRELQVALYIAEGRCDKEIARALGISCYTVREHIRRIFAKLKVSRRSAVAQHMLTLT